MNELTLVQQQQINDQYIHFEHQLASESEIFSSYGDKKNMFCNLKIDAFTVFYIFY